MNQLPITYSNATPAERRKLGGDTFKVLEALRTGPKSSLELERLVGTKRAAARIYDLKRLGHTITRKIETSSEGVRYAVYRLEGA